MTTRRSESSKVMSGEELGRKLLEAVREMKAGAAARVTEITPNQVAAAWQKTGLSQAQFAKALHISARTLQEWEQGRRTPSGAAQALIRIAFRHPEVIRAGDVRHSQADVSKARRLLGYEPRVTMREGVGLAMPWYLGRLG